jgi:hypothetical protein
MGNGVTPEDADLIAQLVFSVVGVAFAVLVILVVGRFWSKVLR